MHHVMAINRSQSIPADGKEYINALATLRQLIMREFDIVRLFVHMTTTHRLRHP